MNTLSGRLLLLLATSSICLAFYSCATMHAPRERNVVKNGIAFKEFWVIEDSFLGTLAEDTVISGYPCKKGFIVFKDDWTLDELRLSEPKEIHGVLFPADTWCFLDHQERVRVCTFPKDMEIQGYQCRGGNGSKKGIQVSFHENGNLRFFYTRHDTVVDGKLCVVGGSLQHGILLHDNGRLAEARMARVEVFDGIEYNGQWGMEFHDNGRLARATLADPQRIAGGEYWVVRNFDRVGTLVENELFPLQGYDEREEMREDLAKDGPQILSPVPENRSNQVEDRE